MKAKLKPQKSLIQHNLPLSKRGEGPNPIDIHVGNRLRVRRIIMDLSQESLADAVGITFQQLQKYERGSNRISASRLFQLAHVLEVPVSYFFEGFTSGKSKSSHKFPDIPADPLADEEILGLIRAYYLLPNNAVRKRAIDLLKVLSGTYKEEDEVV